MKKIYKQPESREAAVRTSRLCQLVVGSSGTNGSGNATVTTTTDENGEKKSYINMD